MFVRYQIVRNTLVAVVVVGAVVAVAYYASRPPKAPSELQSPQNERKRESDPGDPAPTPRNPVAPDPPRNPPAPTPRDPVAPRAPAPRSDKSDCLTKVRRMMATRANAKKRKDALGTTSCKANLYDDDGDGTWDRAKLDVDRDGTWDEAWSRKHGRLERKLSATRQVLIWNGSAWQPKTK